MAAVCASGSERKRSHAGRKLPLIMYGQMHVSKNNRLCLANYVATPSAEILHQHDLAINLVYPSEENPPAVGRNCEAPPDALCFIYAGDLFHIVGQEIEEINL